MQVRVLPGALSKREEIRLSEIPYRLPLEPVIPWFKERVEIETLERFSERIGMSAKRVSDMTTGRTRWISFNKLDKILANEGGRTIIDFYPEYLDEHFVESVNNKKPQGDVVESRTNAKGDRICGVCDGSHYARGLCRDHYKLRQKIERGELKQEECISA